LNESIDFKTFYYEILQNKLPFQLPSDYDKYTDENGELIVNFVGKYESLLSDLTKVFDILQIPFDGKLTREKSSIQPNIRHYRTYYDDETKVLFKKLFKKELELFDYQF
jgi:hypothetical protein